MTQTEETLISTGACTADDAEAIKHFRQAVASGRHWYLALLESIGLWASAEEDFNSRFFRYLIDGEAFDWLLLAERLCETMDGTLPQDEKDALLFHGIPPLKLNSDEVKQLVGDRKYCQYLNFFYGITVEEALCMAVQEEIEKERRAVGLRNRTGTPDEHFQRIYNSTHEQLLCQFRKEKGFPQLKSTTLTELKEFTYWLFKYRLKSCEKAKIASDTKKALLYLNRHWQKKGTARVLSADIKPVFPEE